MPFVGLTGHLFYHSLFYYSSSHQSGHSVPHHQVPDPEVHAQRHRGQAGVPRPAHRRRLHRVRPPADRGGRQGVLRPQRPQGHGREWSKVHIVTVRQNYINLIHSSENSQPLTY